jgi:2,5-diketo-D-gluconate reductase B
MQTVPANGASIPIIGLGTWDLRGKVCARTVAQALRLGYRHIDTAQIYDNERDVGEGVRASGIPRDQLFVTTKIWWTHLSAGDLERSTAECLARLRFQYVDLLLIHWPNASVPLAETLTALGRVKREGLAKHVGVSNFTVKLIEEAAAYSGEPLVTNQIELHPYIDQRKVMEACRRHGISVTAYSPIARGKAQADGLLARIGKTHGKTAAQACLRYLVQQGIIVIPRTSRVERLSENFGIFDFELSLAEMADIRSLASPQGRALSPSWAPEWDH